MSKFEAVGGAVGVLFFVEEGDILDEEEEGVGVEVS